MIISIFAVQKGSDEDETKTSYEVRGKYGADGTEGVIHFFYDEPESGGMGETVTHFLVNGDNAVIKRTGSVESEMRLTVGQDVPFEYSTPYGILNMSARARHMKHDLMEHGGKLELRYDIYYGGEILGRNEFILNIREA